MSNSFEIRLPATRESLRDFYDFFREVSRKIGLPNQTHFDIELSIEEALTNIITHAYHDSTGDFVLRLVDQGSQIQIVIQDWGKPFNPDKIKPFDYNAPVEERINGGMGMHFMRTLMDSVSYSFHDGTTLTMTKKLDHLSPPPPFEEQIEQELHVFDAVARAISTERNANALLDLIVDKLTEVVNADRGTLYLIDRERGELYSKILQDETGRLREIRLKIGEGIAGHVAETGETVNLSSVSDDPHFAQYFDKASGYQTETMICTPMRNAIGEITGVVQLLNKRDGAFTRRDEMILTVLASQAAIAIENARLLASEQEKRRVADTLREVSSIINSSLELEEVLELILGEVERVLPFHKASILLIEDEGLVVRAARGFQHDHLQKIALFRVNENPLIQEMINTHKPIIIPDVEADPRWVKISLTAGMRSWLGTPLIVGNRVIGQLSVNHSMADFYRQANTEVAQTFANQAAAAIERARLHAQTIQQARLQQEVETARSIQTSLLPQKNPTINGWEIAASWEPAKEVAGDFYDFIELAGGRIGFVVADVCGKGIPASLFMTLSRTIFRVWALDDPEISELLARVNNQLKKESASNLFVTLFYGVLDPATGELHYCNGGHNPPILIRHSTPDTPILLESNGPALGIFPNVAYTPMQLTLESGDLLATYTDGITEAIDVNQEEFEEDRLLECILAYRHENAETINENIRHAVKAFTGDVPPEDDATVLIIKRLQFP